MSINVVIIVESDKDINRENARRQEQWSAVIKVDDHRWQRQVKLKMSDYGEKTKGF